MEGALLLGQIAMAFIRDDVRRRAFMALIKAGVDDVFEGIDLDWPGEVPAPEHERAGHG
jgi:hypothetical protein